MIRKISALLCLVFASLAPAAGEETLLLFARHAEKQATPGNPDLTPRGLARSEALAEIAIHWGTTAIYSTDLCRTAQTAQPTAAFLGMPIVIRETGSSSAGLDQCDPPISSAAIFLGPAISSDGDFLNWVIEQHSGSTVLIVGHSNTVPSMLDTLGIAGIAIGDDEYDRLFMVTHDSERGARMVERSYGEEDAEAEAGHRAEGVARLPVVDRALEFHGGALYTASRTRLTISSRSGSFDLAVARDGSEFDYTVEDQRDGSPRTTRITNDSVERRVGDASLDLPEDELQRVRDFVSARVYFPFLPYGLNDPDVLKHDQGLESWGGRELHRVKVTFAPGSSTDASDEYAYWFDPESGRLEQYAYSFGSGSESGGLRFRTLSNYRRVEGLLFFDASNLGVDGSGDFAIDDVTPDYVAERMKPVSEVKLSNLSVEALGG